MKRTDFNSFKYTTILYNPISHPPLPSPSILDSVHSAPVVVSSIKSFFWCTFLNCVRRDNVFFYRNVLALTLKRQKKGLQSFVTSREVKQRRF